MSRREPSIRSRPLRRRTVTQRFVDAWIGLWVHTPIRIMQRLGLMRTGSRPDRIEYGPSDDEGDAAGGGVPAWLPKVPPRMSPGNALTIPREEEIT